MLEAVRKAAAREMRSAGQFVNRVLAEHLISEGLLKPQDVGLEKPARRGVRRAGA